MTTNIEYEKVIESKRITNVKWQK